MKIGGLEARDQHLAVLVELGRSAERYVLYAQGGERPQQAEAGVVVVGDDFGGNGLLAGQQNLRAFRLEDQVADGQHQTVRTDYHARPFTLGVRASPGTVARTPTTASSGPATSGHGQARIANIKSAGIARAARSDLPRPLIASASILETVAEHSMRGGVIWFY